MTSGNIVKNNDALLSKFLPSLSLNLVQNLMSSISAWQLWLLYLSGMSTARRWWTMVDCSSSMTSLSRTLGRQSSSPSSSRCWLKMTRLKMKLVLSGWIPLILVAINKHITRPDTVDAGCGVLLIHLHLDDTHPLASVCDKLSQLGNFKQQEDTIEKEVQVMRSRGSMILRQQPHKFCGRIVCHHAEKDWRLEFVDDSCHGEQNLVI